jgi:LysM repeat protein
LFLAGNFPIITAMRTPLLHSLGLFLVMLSPVWAQQSYSSDNARVELAGLHQDLQLLNQRVGELSLSVEQLNRDNTALQAKLNQNFATVEQLNAAVAEINRTLQAALADQKRETLNLVASQLEKLGRQTNASLDAIAKGQATRPVVQTSFTEDFPKEGINYTVQAGDTLAVIARKNNAKQKDIINANKIADPAKIMVGQTLFIPQAK